MASLPQIRFYDLRHTAATLLLLKGVQPLVVAEMLGHTSVAFTLATYGHVLADMRKPARECHGAPFRRHLRIGGLIRTCDKVRLVKFGLRLLRRGVQLAAW